MLILSAPVIGGFLFNMAYERLDKVLGHLGVGSRKEIHRLARAGLITINGKIVADAGFKFDPSQAHIEVAGEPLVYQKFFYLLLNKPAGYITSTKDPSGTPITALLPEEFWRNDWMPVGRLDKDTEGLLLLTTDGELLHRLTHPRWKVTKRYYVELASPATPEDVAVFAAGTLELEGEPLQPAELYLGPDPRKVELVLREGRFHQVKRMFAARGNQVTYLKRLAFGPLQLPPNLPPGASRQLTPDEIKALYEVVGLPG
ncbi:pseudouridine synthase [Meiothermus ruber]|uniref:Pseudouridine synthase n=1 Tax=Meiothermus ruber (strain ATCC 35948 / DSM 1279 / VKM B-1258 / 21) TaxID=504728 RepID=D3PL67_MEIRD|nr:pseudouridine synthase [Meiothermus ruber]ADD26963.1 pseudouridine synthase [Meiothermus ruber DSM 1279]AGK03416.1 pseudouridine synthase [Meiothermus ruber DSM 1279]MCL6530802.1 rRNA pseudouridine synthase [Meiothermus ruber]